MFSLPEQCKLVSVMRPLDRSSGAFTTEWVCMKNAEKATFIIDLGVMTSTDAQAVTLKVSNTSSGTLNQAITHASAANSLTLEYYYKTSTSIAVDALVKTAVTASTSTFNLTASSNAKFIIIEVEASKMGTFVKSSTTYNADYVALSVATPGVHICLAGVTCLLTGIRYKEDQPPTAVS